MERASFIAGVSVPLSSPSLWCGLLYPPNDPSHDLLGPRDYSASCSPVTVRSPTPSDPFVRRTFLDVYRDPFTTPPLKPPPPPPPPLKPRSMSICLSCPPRVLVTVFRTRTHPPFFLPDASLPVVPYSDVRHCGYSAAFLRVNTSLFSG